MKKISSNASALQTLQNKMIRIIFGLNRNQHINMQNFREKIHMMSVNQMAIYHTLLETYNILWNSASDQIRKNGWKKMFVEFVEFASKWKQT